MGLKFERYYMSRNVHGSAGQGPGWTDSLDFELHSISMGAGDPSSTTATYMRPDGSQIYFTQTYAAASGAFLVGPFTEVGGGGHATLTYNSNGTYTVVDEDAQVYSWTEDTTTGAFPSNKGILASIKDPSGIGWTITHPSTGVTVVTHTSGRYMTLTTTGSLGGVTSLTVTDPAGNNYVYQSVSPNSFSWNLIPSALASVSFPGSNPVTIQYGYTVYDPNSGRQYPKGLTEVDYNGVAHDLTTYDTNGNALSTSLADGTQKNSLAYSTNATGAVVTITNPLGHVSVYQYNASALPISVTGQASSLCAATLSQMTYDANGNMQTEVDNNGNTTQYTYAATGQLQQTVAGAGTSVARTTNYVWDTTPGTNRLLSATVVGWSQTSYTYNAQNRLATVSVKNLSANGASGQTLTTTYQYTLYASGMVQAMSVIHPSPTNSNTDTYSYDTLGNLTSVADGLGQATSYSNYNGLGEPQHIVGPNGDATDFTYDGRGLPLTKTTYPNGAAATWTYTYDQFSLPSSLSAPDGEVTHWNRNAEGVLQTVTHNDKDGTSTETFGYDANGDITSDVVTRGSVISVSRQTTYDELGRVHQQIGNHGQSLTYSYDGNGNVSSVTNAAGHVASYAYDALNRVSTVTESGGATPIPPSTAPTLTVPASNSTGAYSVSWTAVSGAGSYTLQEQTNGGAWTTVQSNSAMSWSASSHPSGTYGYQVQACNVAGCSPWSTKATVTVTRPPATAPALTAPASSATGAYSISWTAVSGASSYTLQERTNGGAWATVQSSSAISWGASGHASGSYGYQVQACNAGGCGPWSSSATVAVTLPPGTAPALTVPGTNSTGAYSISWTAVSGASSYTLQERTNGGAWTTMQSSSASSWSASGHASGTYGYQVQACNAGGCGPWSGTSTVTVALVPQGAPSLTAPASNGTGAYSVSWTSVNFATGYTLQEQVNGGAWTSVYTGSSLNWAASGRVAGTYGYRVQACSTGGCSGWSSTQTTTVSIPISVNGQSYTGYDAIAPGNYGSAIVGFEILTGTTWEVFTSMYNNGMGGHKFSQASGSMPASAVTVKYTWTLVGYPAGMADAGGSVSNPASAPVSANTNPITTYTTATWPQTSPDRGRTYQLRIDFYNATGANISSSVATMTAETTGNP